MNRVLTEETRADNPRGYVYVSLSRSFERMHEWSWFAAMKRGNMTPTKTEFIGWGLDLYDRTMPPDDQVREWTSETVTYLSKTIRENGKGALHFKRRATGKGLTYDVTLKNMPTSIELFLAEQVPDPGYREIEIADELVSVYRRLQELCTVNELRVLQVYVDALPDRLSQQEAADRLGMSKQSVHDYWQGIRRRAQRSIRDSVLS